MLRLMAQHDKHSRLHQIFADTLPPGWETLCRVAALEGSTVIIAAANGAIATKLKAFLPRLLENFQVELAKKNKARTTGYINSPDGATGNLELARAYTNDVKTSAPQNDGKRRATG